MLGMKTIFILLAMFVLVSCVADNKSSIKKTSDKSSLKMSSITGSTSIAPSYVNEANANSADVSTPNCTHEVMKGWKCLITSVTTSENLEYKVAIKWNRPLISSVGTVLLAVGGAGVGESRLDPPSKKFIDELDEIDHIRTIEIEFIDPPNSTNSWGGYFAHFGSYKSASLAFVSALELVLEKGLVKGSFLNYMGGSNGSTVVAYAMSHHGIDRYFDRVVFQMGPFLPDLNNACDPKSASSFYINNPEQQKSVFSLINYWNYGDAAKNVCNYLSNDRTSILKNGKSSFPNTQLHVVIGAKEETEGFGKWILASNLEWYNGIHAKTKSRIIRPNMGHNNSYEDMRRYLKLKPNEVAVEETPTSACTSDSKGTFPNGQDTVEWLCRGCQQNTPPPSDSLGGPWMDQGNSCYHRVLHKAKTCSNGTFCANKRVILWSCDCGQMDSSWNSQGNNCYHKASTASCQ